MSAPLYDRIIHEGVAFTLPHENSRTGIFVGTFIDRSIHHGVLLKSPGFSNWRKTVCTFSLPHATLLPPRRLLTAG